MADKTQFTNTPHSTSPPNPPYTPRATSIPDDSETEFNPTPLHSPGGPQYEDLPPSYDLALNDARNGVASLDASQIEAHRVSANEGPDEPEVWEYRMRGEDGTEEESNEREEAPAYEGHVPVQHVANSESIPVGRVRDLNASPSLANRGTAQSEDPPHSVPREETRSSPAFNPDWSNGHSQHYGFGGRGSHGGGSEPLFGSQARGPFGASGNGPFGRPGRGPFGGPGQGPFGRGRGNGRSASGPSRPSSAQDWAAFGQNIGKMGEQFGRRMGNWGEQFGRQAGAMGEQIGRRAGAMGQQIGRSSNTWAAGGYATAVQRPQAAGPSTAERSGLPQYDEPPSYQGPAGVAGQETVISHGDRKVDTYPPEKEAEAAFEQPSEKTLSKQKADDYDDDDDSSISSDSSGSSSSSDSEEDDYDNAQAVFLKRIESINATAELAASKGKKSAEEIAHERDLAITKATREKEASEVKLARRQSRRTQKRDLRNRKRELTREYRQKKLDLRSASEASGKDKGKGKAKKGKEWKEAKREYKMKRKALKRERVDAKREWKREKREDKMRQNEALVDGG